MKDAEFAAALDRIQPVVITSLWERFPADLPIEKLIEGNLFEDALKVLLWKLMQLHVLFYLPEGTVQADGTLAFRGMKLKIDSGDDIGQPGSYTVVLRVVEPEGAIIKQLNTTHSSKPLKDCSRYNNLTCIVPAKLDRLHIDRFSRLAATIVEAAYWHLDRRLEIYFETQELRLAKRMYLLVRGCIDDEKISQEVWFWMVAQDSDGDWRGAALFDQQAGSSAFANLAQAARSSGGRDPYHDVPTLIGTTLRYNEMNSRHALNGAAPMPFRIDQSVYAHEKSDFINAFIGMFRGAEHVVFPIVREGNPLLVAIFPQDAAEYVVPRLNRWLPTLSKGFRDIIEAVGYVARVRQPSALIFRNRLSKVFRGVIGHMVPVAERTIIKVSTGGFEHAIERVIREFPHLPFP